MKNPMKGKENYSFFSRMLLICTILMIAFSIITSAVVINLSEKYERTKYLSTYEAASVSLLEAFSRHFSDFYILAGKLITGNSPDTNLCALLEAPSYEEMDFTARNNCFLLLKEICDNDQYIQGFLLYSAEQEILYYYSNSLGYMTYTSDIPDVTFPDFFYKTALDVETISSLITACTGNQDFHSACYGLTATIYRNPNNPLGFLIPLYSCHEYDDILSYYQFETEYTFLITDRNGNVYYQTAQGLDPEAESSYAMVHTNERYGLQITCYLPEYSLSGTYNTLLILFFAVIVSLFSLILYYLSLFISKRNIDHILSGMEAFTLDNLTYRMEQPRSKNEFSRIIQGFNSMCDELQHSIEQSYIYELSQKKCDLYALQTSINPHFLYNTLEIIRAQILSKRPDDASRMLLLLSKIYRSQTRTNLFVTINDEIEFNESLIELYQYRFQNFDYEVDADAGVIGYGIPKGILQPLIENYLVHGIVQSRTDNYLLLEAFSYYTDNGKYICLRLSNNGQPISEEKIKSLEEKLSQTVYDKEDTSGFALTNVISRLRIIFANDCHIYISSGNEYMNFQIELHFPAKPVSWLEEHFVINPKSG